MAKAAVAKSLKSRCLIDIATRCLGYRPSGLNPGAAGRSGRDERAKGERCLETLAAIKNDPELRLIPVVVLSAGGSPEEVRRSYAAHATCYVRRPTDLDGSMKFMRAVEAFWMDFALLPTCEDGTRIPPQVTNSKEHNCQRRVKFPHFAG